MSYPLYLTYAAAGRLCIACLRKAAGLLYAADHVHAAGRFTTSATRLCASFKTVFFTPPRINLSRRFNVNTVRLRRGVLDAEAGFLRSHSDTFLASAALATLKGRAAFDTRSSRGSSSHHAFHVSSVHMGVASTAARFKLDGICLVVA